MPGTDVCGRCGTSMGIATAVIDVHPPRARPLTKRLRRRLPIHRAAYAARDAFAHAGTAAAARRIALSFPPSPVFLRLIVPGWSHLYTGQRVRGHLFLWSFLACLLPGLLLWGSGWGSIWLGLAFSVHSSAALDVVMQTFADCGMRDRIARSIAVSVLVGVVVYWPAGWLLTRLADPQVITMRLTDYAVDDVVLVNHWANPAPGRMVLYDIPDYTARLRDGHRNIYTHFRGGRIERILAGPGAAVRVERGYVFINGRPSRWQPRDPGRLPTLWTQTVPPDHYFILPTTTNILPAAEDVVTWESVSMVPSENILGRAYARSQPLSRFKLIR
jgi:hypothetical protein